MINTESKSGVCRKKSIRVGFIAALVVGNLLATPNSYGELTTEFLAFPSVTATNRSENPTVHGLDGEDFIPALDLFFTAGYGDLRALIEVYGEANGHHGGHVERFQVGWLPDSSDLEMWAGRFHNPVGFWNTAYHHGNYLQTSISRPAILEFEDEGGVIPMHLSGLFIENRFNTAGSIWKYAFGVGAGPYFKEHLEAVDLFGSEENSTGLVSTLRLSWQPSNSVDNQVGVFLSSGTIPGVASKFEELKQQVGGGYADWNFRSLRIMTAAFFISNDIKQGGIRSDGGFVNGYIQVEAPWNGVWTPYGRVERSASEEDDPFLPFVNGFILDRTLIGVRYDLTQNQSIKMELSDVDHASSDYSQISLQWSALLP